MADDRTDRELMIAVRDRSEVRALEELVCRWDGRLLAYLGKLVGNVATARDLRQETYLRVWRFASTYNDVFAFSTWLIRIATNLARTYMGRHPNSAAVLEPAVTDSAGEERWPVAVRRVIADEQELVLRKSLDGLAVADKELLLMRFQLELTYNQIADVVGCPESTAKSRVSALLRRLRLELEQQGLDARNTLP